MSDNKMEDPRQLKQTFRRREEQKMRLLSSVYGSSLPFSLILERNIVSQQGRVGLPSSRLHLEILTGKDTELQFPAYIEEMPKITQEIHRLNLV